MAPRIDKSCAIECPDAVADVVKFEEARAAGNQQANPQLNRGDILDEVLLGENAEQIGVYFRRRPRRKRNERGMQRHAEPAKVLYYGKEIGAGMSFIEP